MITLLGKKKGMGSVFTPDGRQTPVTVLQVGPCPVMQVKTLESDGYNAVQIGFEPVRTKLVNQAKTGHCKKAGCEPHRVLHEFKPSDVNNYKTGDVLGVDTFKPGDRITVTGTSKGRGFAGVIKRHGFGRPKQTHGTHESFRGTGSIGQCSYPSRVWPGKKMPGRMAARTITVKNLTVINVDADKKLLMVKGAIPGSSGGYVQIMKAE